MLTRRIAVALTAVAVAAGGLGVAVSSVASHSGAATTTWYQCVNGAGKIESKLGGTTIPKCAHLTDTILQWQVDVGTLPPTTTAATTPPTPAPTPAPTAPPTTPTVHIPTPTWWQPSSSHSLNFWNQQNGTVTVHPGVQVYITDWAATTPTQHASFHVSGAKSVCQINGGQFEPGRPDAVQFPAGAVGNSTFPLGPPGSKWLDIRNQTIRDIMIARIETCAQRGGDAADFTGLDGYANVSGFPLTSSDQLAYNAFLAATAHANGLSAGLDEDRAQIGALNTTFDFGTAIQAQFLGQAGDFLGFTEIGRAVFDTEFFGGLTFCPADAFDHISGISANLALDGTGVAACPSW